MLLIQFRLLCKELKHKRHKGEISIFFCMILISLLILFGVLLDLARIKAAENQAQNILDRSLRSMMAGYDQTLSGEYGLFGVPLANAEAEFRKYLEANLTRESQISFPLVSQRIENITITPMLNLSDVNVLEKQIIEFMKFRAPFQLSLEVYDKFKAIIDITDLFDKSVSNAGAVSSDNNSSQNGSKKYEKPEKDQTAFERYQNLIESFKNLKGVLPREEISNLKPGNNSETNYDYIFNDLDKKLESEWDEAVSEDSQHEISPDTSAIDRLKEIAAMFKNGLTGMRDAIYVNEYIIYSMSCFTNEKPDRRFPRGEVEYILFQQSGEKVNVLLAQSSVALIRMAIRSIEAFSDSKIPTFKLRLLWSLLKGLYKSFDDISKLMDPEYESRYQGVELSERIDKIRLTYPDYLRIFLLMTGRERKLVGIQHILQANLKDKAAEASDNSKDSGAVDESDSGYFQMAGAKLDSYSTFIEASVTTSIPLLFLPIFQVDKMGFSNIRGGRYYITKTTFFGY